MVLLLKLILSVLFCLFCIGDAAALFGGDCAQAVNVTLLCNNEPYVGHAIVELKNRGMLWDDHLITVSAELDEKSTLVRLVGDRMFINCDDMKLYVEIESACQKTNNFHNYGVGLFLEFGRRLIVPSPKYKVCQHVVASKADSHYTIELNTDKLCGIIE